jgi:PKD repeat protein
MAYSIRTRNVVTPRPSLTIGARPLMTAASNSVGAIATAITGLWTGPRNTFAFQWYRSAATIANATNASFSYQSAGTHTVLVTVTNPFGSRTSTALPITIL